MKKIFLLMQDKDVVSALEYLHGLGLMHVDSERVPEDERIESLRRDEQLLQKALDILHTVEGGAEPAEPEDWRAAAQQVISAHEQIGRLQEDMARRRGVIRQWEAWGDFDPKDFSVLEQKGVYLKLVEFGVNSTAEVPDGVILEEIFVRGKTAHCLAISRSPLDDLPFKDAGLPPESLVCMNARQEADEGKTLELEESIRNAAVYSERMQAELMAAHNQLVFTEVLEGRTRVDGLAMIKGFCPRDQVDRLVTAARSENWGVLVEDPKSDDHIPTLIRQRGFLRLIQPVFKMINVLPGYREFDISPVFLLFFTIFVAMLIGDAGYALIYAAATGLAHVKAGAQIKDHVVFRLLYLLWGATFVWGVLTGTYFGQAWITPMIPPVMPWLVDINNIQWLCFLLGALHLSIAHFWRTVESWPSVRFLGQTGWLAIIWGMYFGACTLVLGRPFPQAGAVLLYSGSALVVLFSKPDKNILKAVGAGLGELALNIINSFTDVVSYIRLFAVGMATVAVADAANGMLASSIQNPNVINVLVGVIAFLLHPLNLLLALMALMVHGLRLNMLEFSGHLGMEWAGFPYKPFQKAKA